jgi:dihydrofolate reductase
MSKVTCNLSVSADGFSAGHNQTEERPFGDDGGDGWGNRLHAWMFDNAEENRTEVDQTTDARAYIMGRNMFGPVRGEWDRQWNGGGVTICRSTPRPSCSPTTRDQ